MAELGGLTPAQQQEMAASFNAFLSRPENRELALQAQAEEAQAAIEAAEAAQYDTFLDKVRKAGPSTAAALEPFLRVDVLRRVVMTFANTEDPTGLKAWAENGQAQALLGQALGLLRSGRMSEAEMEYALLAALKAPANPHSQQFKEVSQPTVTLPTEQLAVALNEQLAERRSARAALKSGRAEDAVAAAQRALAVLRLVRGTNEDDTTLIRENTVVALLEHAEASIAAQQYGAAIDSCTEALQLSGQPDTRALLLRARAQTWRREYKEAQRDLSVVSAAPGDSSIPQQHTAEVQEVMQLMQRLRREDKAADTRLFGRMFSGGGAGKKSPRTAEP